MWRTIASLLVILGMLAAAKAIADIRETPHNLIKSRDKTVSDRQVCVFCHTPLNEAGELPQGTASALAPRWQRSLVDGFIYTIYDDIGRLGLGKASVGSQSLACLSCHDSNQAVGLGRVSGDHPFGVPYRGAVNHPVRTGAAQAGGSLALATDPLAPLRAAQHALELEDFREASQATVENRAVFWVSRDGVTARRSRNDLPLYGRNYDSELLGQSLMVPHIECSSCHDPHAETQTFLRASAAGSELCLTCHDK